MPQLPPNYLEFDITQLSKSIQDIESQLQQPDIARDMSKFTALNREYTQLTKLNNVYSSIRSLAAQIEQAEELVNDAELGQIAQGELSLLQKQLDPLLAEFDTLTLPKLEDDEKGAILEFRAGTGGAEAALFTEELHRAYLRYISSLGWAIEESDINYQGEGGIKEATVVIRTAGAFGQLRFEAGVHRVQRVPKTEAAGRIHTSAVSIAILPVVESTDINIDPQDIRIDVFRAGGPGGQSVNTTDSAVRVTHIPTGIVVSCQDGKSQHKNKAKAMEILASKLYQLEQEAAASKNKELRSAAIKSGDRSAKIRTFNFPQGRVTDHRVRQSWYNLTEVMEGQLEEIVTTVNSHLRQNPNLEIADEDE